MKNFLSRAIAIACAALLAACAVPQIDRFMLETERVRLEGPRGPLTRAQTEQVLAQLRAKSPNDAVLDRHIAVEEALAGNPLTIGNRVTLLEDGPATYAAMLAAIASARSHVHMESYIFEGDQVGRQFAQALIDRRKAGLEVRLVYDAVGSITTPRAFFKEIADQGVDVLEFNPIKPGTVLTQGLALQRRNHRKLLVIDGKVAFLGGINISGVYTPDGLRGQRGGSVGGSGDDDTRPFEERPWRDTQVRIEGPAVEDFQRSFLKIWARQKKEAPAVDKRYFPPSSSVGPHLVRAVEGSPDDGANALYVTLISAIESAESEVRITAAYFVPHEQLLEALKQAAQRGVKVQLLLPGRTDNWMVFAAGRSYYDEMLQAGVKVFERKKRMLHSKTATVDGVWSTVGSTNLDWRSLAYNDEINAVVLGPEFATQMNASFAKDLLDSQEITLEAWRQRSLADRLREITARAAAKLL